MILFNNFTKKELFLFVITVLFAYISFANISYTDDYFGYEKNYYSLADRNDLGFAYLESFCRNLHLEFRQFYNVAIAVQICVFTLFLSKMRTNVPLVAFLAISMCYVQMANQLRYFIAFPLFLLAVYELIVEKKYLKSVLIGIVSFSFHSAIIPLFSFIPYYYYFKNEVSLRKIIIKSVGLGIIILIFFSTFSSYLIQVDEKYLTYVSSEGASTLGMMFIILLPICFLFFICKLSSSVRDKIENTDNKFLYLLSLFPIVWMVTSFSGFQIINARYVNAFTVVWFLMLFRLTVDFDNKKYHKLILIFVCVFVVKYVVPLFFFHHSELEKIAIIWASKG